MEAIFTEMDDVMQKVDEAMVAIDMGRMQSDFMPTGVKLDIFTAAEFIKEQDAFLFDANQYSETWDSAEDGKVAIFQMDGSVDFVDEKDAFAAREVVDKTYEADFAEALMIQADKEADQLYAQMDQLMESGASNEEREALFKKIDNQMAAVYLEVDAAFQEVILVEMKTDVLMIAEESASLKSDIAEAKETGMLNGVKVSKEEIAAAEEAVASLDMEVQAGRADFAEEVKFASQEMPEMDMEVPEMQMKEMEMEMMQFSEDQGMKMEMEMQEMEKFYMEIKEYYQPDQFAIGTTTYVDLNQISSGEDVYSGNTTNLVVTDAGSSAAKGAELNDVVGSFKATTTINYSSRTVTQGATITVNKLGQNTTARNFSVSNDNSYSSATGNVQPKNAYNIGGNDNSYSATNVESINNGNLTKTVTTDATYVEQGTKENTHYFVTVESNVQNTSGQTAAGTVQTTVTVSSEQTDGGDLNVASGTDSPANKN
jgi:hypothetical protein